MNFPIKKFLALLVGIVAGPAIAMEQGSRPISFFVIEDEMYRTVVLDPKTEKFRKIDLGTVADIEKTGEIVREINPDYQKYSDHELVDVVIGYWRPAPIPFIPYATIYALREVVNLEKRIGKEIIPQAVFYKAAMHLARHNPEHGALFLFGGALERFKQYLAKADQTSFDTLRTAFSSVRLRPAWVALIEDVFSAMNPKGE